MVLKDMYQVVKDNIDKKFSDETDTSHLLEVRTMS